MNVPEAGSQIAIAVKRSLTTSESLGLLGTFIEAQEGMAEQGEYAE